GQLTALAVAEFGADSVEVLDIWAVIARCCALSRLRFAARCCALSRLRFAARCCALSRLRFADRPYSQRVHTDVFEELQLGSEFVGIHFSNCTTRSRILSAITRLVTRGISSIWPDASISVA